MLGSNLLLRPVELGPVDPHAMQNDCELARDRDFGEGSAMGTFADAAPLSSKSRNFLPSGVICQPELSRKTYP